ncbi:MAG: Gx transporter family protein [Acutalibacteraceae bacterium]|jgi:heptaprenyl diphosphate synthase
MKTRTKRIAFLSVFAALAMVLAYLELLLPPVFLAVPGIKVGLPNIIIIFLLYRFSLKDALTVSFLRLVVVSLLFGNAVTFVYSLAGAILSILVMAVLKKTNKFSTIGVSIAGGVSHNLGQIIVAVWLLRTKEIAYYMGILAVFGMLAGIFVGLSGILLLRYTEKIKF